MLLVASLVGCVQYYPVDNFFSSYVDELAQRASKRQAEGGERKGGPLSGAALQAALEGWVTVVSASLPLPWRSSTVLLLLGLLDLVSESPGGRA